MKFYNFLKVSISLVISILLLVFILICILFTPPGVLLSWIYNESEYNL